jgi:hypothetical protein
MGDTTLNCDTIVIGGGQAGLLSLALIPNSICVLTEAMTSTMCIALWSKSAISLISNTNANEANPCLKTALSQVKRASLLADGLLNVPSDGLPSVAACVSAGARKSTTGWL